ncbi:MAG: hypothetical protein ACM3KM_02800 [Acidobacteriaceae bacterium]
MIKVNKKNLLTVAAVCLVAVLVVVGILVSNRKPATVNQPEQQKEEEFKESDNKLNFISGTVTKTDGNKIYFKSVDGQEKLANVGSDTKLIKQVKDKKGVFSIVEASVADFKEGTSFVAYPGTTKAEFSPVKIQILK